MKEAKISLKEKLNALIEMEGYIPYEKIVAITMEEGYKISNAERRLRHSESPNVRPVMKTSKRGTQYIGGYEWINRVTLPLAKMPETKAQTLI